MKNQNVFFLRRRLSLTVFTRFDCLLVCFSRVPPRSCILCTMSSMEIRSSTSGYRIKDGDLKGRNAEVSIFEGKIDFTNSACKESRVRLTLKAQGWEFQHWPGGFTVVSPPQRLSPSQFATTILSNFFNVHGTRTKNF